MKLKIAFSKLDKLEPIPILELPPSEVVATIQVLKESGWDIIFSKLEFDSATGDMFYSVWIRHYLNRN